MTLPRLYDEANAIRLRGAPSWHKNYNFLTGTQDGDIQADDVLNIGNLNTFHGGGQAFLLQKLFAPIPKHRCVKSP